jgi:uncharacterized CHY-type Zn-finger protein
MAFIYARSMPTSVRPATKDIAESCWQAAHTCHLHTDTHGHTQNTHTHQPVPRRATIDVLVIICASCRMHSSSRSCGAARSCSRCQVPIPPSDPRSAGELGGALVVACGQMRRKPTDLQWGRWDEAFAHARQNAHGRTLWDPQTLVHMDGHLCAGAPCKDCDVLRRDLVDLDRDLLWSASIVSTHGTKVSQT